MSEMEFRFSFYSKVIGMLISDVGMFMIWILFFNRFKELNGWTIEDSVMLFAIGMMNFALFRMFAGGTEKLAKTIVRGEFDYYLTLPKSPLWQISTSRLDVSAFGDLLFALILFIFFSNPTAIHTFVFIFVSVITASILYNVVVIFQSLAFYFTNFEESADRLYWTAMSMTFYPSTAFGGVLKFLSFTLMPAFFLVWLPVDLIKEFKFTGVCLLLGFWLLTLILAMQLFNRGLKRYESGNLINVKM